MQEIIFLKGLPASGKSTFAKQFCKENPRYIRINKDDIREEFGNPAWSREFEKKVLETQRERGIKWLEESYSLIVDDTNFASVHWDFWENEAKKRNIQIREKLFDVDVEECIKRDKAREKSVGEAVIRKMFKDNIKNNMNKKDMRFIAYQNIDLPKCILCDLDGTLALINGRSPYEDAKVPTDKVNWPVRRILQRYYELGVEIIYLSGRSDISRNVTEQWLKDNACWFHNNQKVLMRVEGDYRKDAITKKEIFDNNIRDKYFVEFVLDDRNQVVDMWRDLGLLCLQVYYGNF